jgi:hypothetical protein
MEVLKWIGKLMIAFALAGIAYCMARAGSEWYLEQLNESGGMVTADSILCTKALPYLIALFVLYWVLKIQMD